MGNFPSYPRGAISIWRFWTCIMKNGNPCRRIRNRFKNVQTPKLLSKEVTHRVAHDPKVKKVIILTGEDHGRSEISLIESGAYDYWNKGELLNEQLFQKRLEETLDLPSRYSVKEFQQDFADPAYVKEKFNFDDAVREIDKNLIGKNPEIDRVKRLIFEASQFDESVPVLITGETGTGKEVVATLIHRLSKRGRVMRRDNPVTINCGIYSDDNLLRAELFGTHRGAFTGAMEREGVLEANKGTTLFLDEVGNSLPRFQEILLRAIENREGARLGSSKSNEYKIDLRFIAATDRNIIDDKQFSQPFLNRIRGSPYSLAVAPGSRRGCHNAGRAFSEEGSQDRGSRANRCSKKGLDGVRLAGKRATTAASDGHTWQTRCSPPGNLRQAPFRRGT